MTSLIDASTASPPRIDSLGGRSRAVAVWLFVVAALVFLMVVVGGATRLTGSGLSITEWQPIVGVAPPLSARAWAEAFGKYRATSQYHLINQGISLADFQVLFWWEWGHRLLGRWIGVVFAVPFVTFIVLRRIPKSLIGRCLILLALGGLQGLVGWWMVESGLEGRAAVAPERLATHLGLALILLSALVWTGLDAWAGDGPGNPARQGRWRVAALLLMTGVFVQCLLGAFVSGNSAGLIDNDWPLMAGRLVPADYWGGGLWATLAHGRAAVQFNHRMMAYALLVSGLTVAALVARDRSAAKPVVYLALLTGGLLIAQVALGIATLVAGVPLWMALSHQANAVAVLVASVAFAWRAGRA
jgi:cytochrome c oxidase assembly protein subunit 15